MKNEYGNLISTIYSRCKKNQQTQALIRLHLHKLPEHSSYRVDDLCYSQHIRDHRGTKRHDREGHAPRNVLRVSILSAKWTAVSFLATQASSELRISNSRALDNSFAAAAVCCGSVYTMMVSSSPISIFVAPASIAVSKISSSANPLELLRTTLPVLSNKWLVGETDPPNSFTMYFRSARVRRRESVWHSMITPMEGGTIASRVKDVSGAPLGETP